MTIAKTIDRVGMPTEILFVGLCRLHCRFVGTELVVYNRPNHFIVLHLGSKELLITLIRGREDVCVKEKVYLSCCRKRVLLSFFRGWEVHQSVHRPQLITNHIVRLFYLPTPDPTVCVVYLKMRG